MKQKTFDSFFFFSKKECAFLKPRIFVVGTKHLYIYVYTYLPTPPLGQDMTQGPFLSGV